MTAARGLPDRIDIRVTVHPAHADLATGPQEVALREGLTVLADEILGDLAIPAAGRVVVGPMSADANGRGPYGLAIGDRPCRLELGDRQEWSSSPERLSRRLARDLCRNRRLFVSAQLSERIRHAWASGRTCPAATLSGAAFHDLLLRLVERGSRVDRLCSLAVDAGAARDERRCREALEESIAASPDATALRALVSGRARETLGAGISMGDNRSLASLLGWTADSLFSELGLLLPPPDVAADPRLDGPDIRIQVNDLRWPPIEGLGSGEWLVDAPGEALRERGIAAGDVTHPLTGEAWSRVPGADGMVLRRCREMAFTVGSAGYVVTCLRAAAHRHAPHLLTTGAVQCLLFLLHETDPALVEAAGARFGTPCLTWILRDLLKDGVCIRDLRSILEGLLSIEGPRASAVGGAVSSSDMACWSDSVRAALYRQITQRHTSPGPRLDVHQLAAHLEARIRDSEARPLPEEERLRLLEELLDKQTAWGSRPVVIVTLPDVARRIRCLIREELPRVHVIAYQELNPDVEIRTLGRIGEK